MVYHKDDPIALINVFDGHFGHTTLLILQPQLLFPSS